MARRPGRAPVQPEARDSEIRPGWTGGERWRGGCPTPLWPGRRGRSPPPPAQPGRRQARLGQDEPRSDPAGAFGESAGDEGFGSGGIALHQANLGEAGRRPRGEQRQVLRQLQRAAEGRLGLFERTCVLQGDSEGAQGGGGPPPVPRESERSRAEAVTFVAFRGRDAAIAGTLGPDEAGPFCRACGHRFGDRASCADGHGGNGGVRRLRPEFAAAHDMRGRPDGSGGAAARAPYLSVPSPRPIGAACALRHGLRTTAPAGLTARALFGCV